MALFGASPASAKPTMSTAGWCRADFTFSVREASFSASRQGVPEARGNFSTPLIADDRDRDFASAVTGAPASRTYACPGQCSSSRHATARSNISAGRRAAEPPKERHRCQRPRSHLLRRPRRPLRHRRAAPATRCMHCLCGGEPAIIHRAFRPCADRRKKWIRTRRGSSAPRKVGWPSSE
jgi:hypothetical protein